MTMSTMSRRGVRLTIAKPTSPWILVKRTGQKDKQWADVLNDIEEDDTGTSVYNRRVYIGNIERLDHDYQVVEFEKLLRRKAATYKHLEIHADGHKVFAFVNFSTSSDAGAAVTNLHGASFGSRYIVCHRSVIPDYLKKPKQQVKHITVADKRRDW